MMAVKDEYTAYCFDEACFYILSMIKEGKKPHFENDKGKATKGHYSSFSDLYKQYD